MLYATLICSDETCAEEFEAWGELADIVSLQCELCGCGLQPLAFSSYQPLGAITPLPRRLPHVQLRDAA